MVSGLLTEVTLINSAPLGQFGFKPDAAMISAMRGAAARRRIREQAMNASCPATCASPNRLIRPRISDTRGT